MWDGEKFKGGRSFNFRGGISPQLEIALLADGVPMDKLYPLDVERAWKSMDRLRPLVTKWYESHAEAIQLVTAGEVDIACTIGPRGIDAKRSGAPVDVDYNQGKLGSDYWCLVKGSQNRDAAVQFINFALDGKRQAGMVKENPYGPSNSTAFDFLTAEEAKDLTTSPDNIKRAVLDRRGVVGQDRRRREEREPEAEGALRRLDAEEVTEAPVRPARAGRARRRRATGARARGSPSSRRWRSSWRSTSIR